jgi:hypothetical protein
MMVDFTGATPLFHRFALGHEFQLGGVRHVIAKTTHRYVAHLWVLGLRLGDLEAASLTVI